MTTNHTKHLNVEAFPCAWPIDWPRTSEYDRRASPYRSTFQHARDGIIRRLRLMGAVEVVISTNRPGRGDAPLPGGSDPRDPAVAVYWAERGEYRAGHQHYQYRVVACDHWRRLSENMRAVHLALDALHTMKRTGTSQLVDRAFTGFTALAPDNRRRSWREVLEWIDGWRVSIENIEARFRDLAPKRHPDLGGSHEAMTELNLARVEALREASSHG